MNITVYCKSLDQSQVPTKAEPQIQVEVQSLKMHSSFNCQQI